VNVVVRLVVWLMVAVRVVFVYGIFPDVVAGPPMLYVEELEVCVVEVVATALKDVIVWLIVVLALEVVLTLALGLPMNVCPLERAVMVTIASEAVFPLPCSVIVVFVNETPMSLMTDGPFVVTIQGQSVLSASQIVLSATGH
jgi:hypothetical protein